MKAAKAITPLSLIFLTCRGEKALPVKRSGSQETLLKCLTFAERKAYAPLIDFIFSDSENSEIENPHQSTFPFSSVVVNNMRSLIKARHDIDTGVQRC
jgi:hypothetical protein